MGQFQKQHDPLVLLAVAADVLRAADPRTPERVSQRRYDETREVVGHADTPRGHKLAERFEVSWATLRDRALHADDPAGALAISRKKQTRRVLTETAANAAIQRVATRLGTSEISQFSYERERRAMNEVMRRSHTHGAQLMPLPSFAAIDKRHGFKRLVEQAGLTTGNRTVPLLPRADAVVAFVEHYGFAPKVLEVNWMGAHYGIQFVALTKDPHAAAVEEARRRFEAAGRWFPPVARGTARPDSWKHLGDGSPELAALARAYPRKRHHGEAYTLDDAREIVRRAYDLMPPGTRLGAESYRALGRQPGMPNYRALRNAIRSAGLTFDEVVRDEAARRALLARDASTSERP